MIDFSRKLTLEDCLHFLTCVDEPIQEFDSFPVRTVQLLELKNNTLYKDDVKMFPQQKDRVLTFNTSENIKKLTELYTKFISEGHSVNQIC